MPTAIKVPYELLVRWREGVISGAHVGWSLLVTEDDGTKREMPQTVEPVEIGQGKGFPLADILEKLYIDALVALDLKVAEHAEAITAKDQEHAEAIAAKEQERAAEQAVREAKAQEAAQLAVQVEAQAAELTDLKMPEEEKRKAAIQAQIERLQASLEGKTKKEKPKLEAV